MTLIPLDGPHTIRQSTPSGAADPQPSGKAPGQSASGASPREKVLLTYAEAGALMGVSKRTAHNIVPTLVQPVILGPRCVRIVRAELEAAVANLPRRTDPQEPAQLLRGKSEKLKGMQAASSGAALSGASA